MADTEKQILGKFGEDIAADYLEKNGYRITERNLHIAKNELDIIAEDKDCIVFVEVKTRKASTDTEKYGKAQDAVNEEKRAHMRYTAGAYILRFRMQYLKPRFDFAEVYYTEGKRTKFKIHYRKEAF